MHRPGNCTAHLARSFRQADPSRCQRVDPVALLGAPRYSQRTMLALAAAIAFAALQAPGSLPDPLIIIPAARGVEQRLSELPALLRRHLALQIAGSDAHRLAAWAEKLHASTGLPIIAHIRTWHQQWTPDGPRPWLPAADLPKLFAAAPHLAGIIAAEQDVGGIHPEERRYIAELLRTCSRFRRLCILDWGGPGLLTWHELLADPAMRSLIHRCAKIFVPTWEMNVPAGNFENHACILGLFLAGLCQRWGINPQTWYWAEAGFSDLGQDLGFRHRRSILCNADYFARVRSKFPLYPHAIALGLISGARVIWIGGERPPNAWDESSGSIRWSHQWRRHIQPLLLAALSAGWGPSRSDVARCASTAIRCPPDLLVRWPAEGRTGRGLLLRAGRALIGNLRIYNFAPIKVRPGQRVALRAWARCRNLSGAAQIWLAWLSDMTFIRESRSASISGTADWTELRAAGTAPDNARCAICFAEVRGAGEAWFDDFAAAVESTPVALQSPSFETASPWSPHRPAGWGIACFRNPFDPAQIASGLAAIWHAAYGARIWCELIPNFDRGFFVPIAPPGTRLACPATIDAGRILSIADARRALGQRAKPRPADALAAACGPMVLLANSRENDDMPAAAQLSHSHAGWRITASAALPAHGLLCLWAQPSRLTIAYCGHPGEKLRAAISLNRAVALTRPAPGAAASGRALQISTTCSGRVEILEAKPAR